MHAFGKCIDANALHSLKKTIFTSNDFLCIFVLKISKHS